MNNHSHTNDKRTDQKEAIQKKHDQLKRFFASPMCVAVTGLILYFLGQVFFSLALAAIALAFPTSIPNPYTQNSMEISGIVKMAAAGFTLSTLFASYQSMNTAAEDLS